MSKNKLARFAENETFTNLYQHTSYDLLVEPFPLKGKWVADHFKNDKPLVLELGCGRGEYTLALAERFPDVNFIGVDRKGARLWRGCKTALEQNLSNAAFLRIAIDRIEHYFAPNEVDEIWITFPDPQPNRVRQRLLSPYYIERYKKFLKEGAPINLKTDSRMLYEYTLETIEKEGWKLLENIEDVYKDQNIPLLTEVQTFYEKMWLKEGKEISYLRFTC